MRSAPSGLLRRGGRRPARAAPACDSTIGVAEDADAPHAAGRARARAPRRGSPPSSARVRRSAPCCRPRCRRRRCSSGRDGSGSRRRRPWAAIRGNRRTVAFDQQDQDHERECRDGQIEREARGACSCRPTRLRAEWRDARRLHHFPQPELQHEQGPELVAEGDAAGDVILDGARERRGLEPARDPRVARQQMLAREVDPGPAEPLLEGDARSRVFALVEVALGSASRNVSFSRPLSRPPGSFCSAGISAASSSRWWSSSGERASRPWAMVARSIFTSRSSGR